MRKLAITIFAVLYVVLVITVSVERTNDWAVRQTEAGAHPCLDQHTDGFSKAEKTETHLYQTKLVESYFVVESPREAAAVSLYCERYTPLSPDEDLAAQSGQQVPSRAPPALA